MSKQRGKRQIHCFIGATMWLATIVQAEVVVIVPEGEVHHIGNNSSMWPDVTLEDAPWSANFDLSVVPSDPVILTLDVYGCESEGSALGEIRVNGVWVCDLPDITETEPTELPGPDDWTTVQCEFLPVDVGLGQQDNSFWIQGGGDGTDDMLFHNVVLDTGVAIPALSEWGLVAMTLLFLTAGTLLYARRRPAQA